MELSDQERDEIIRGRVAQPVSSFQIGTRVRMAGHTFYVENVDEKTGKIMMSTRNPYDYD